jgi:hypothetical protein
VRRLYPGGERTINIGAPGGFNLVWKRGRERRFVFEIYKGVRHQEGRDAVDHVAGVRLI